MNDSLKDISRASQPAPRVERAAHRESAIPNRLPRYVSFLVLLAALSTVAGYQAARLDFSAAIWFRKAPPPASASIQPHALVPASNSGANNSAVETISHLAPNSRLSAFSNLPSKAPTSPSA